MDGLQRQSCAVLHVYEMLQQQPMLQQRGMFDTLDRNGDGTISRAEWNAAGMR